MTRVGISESGVTSSLPGSWVLVGCPAKIQPITLTAVKKLKTMILLSISLKSTPRNHDSRTAISWIILVANERREVEKIFLTFRKTRPNQQTIEFRYFQTFHFLDAWARPDQAHRTLPPKKRVGSAHCSPLAWCHLSWIPALLDYLDLLPCDISLEIPFHGLWCYSSLNSTWQNVFSFSYFEAYKTSHYIVPFVGRGK